MYNDKCNLFSKSSTSLTLFEAITINESSLSFNIIKPECYKSHDVNIARKTFLDITGLQATNWPFNVTGFKLQVFRLYLD